jgi:hypothetical protein
MGGRYGFVVTRCRPTRCKPQTNRPEYFELSNSLEKRRLHHTSVAGLKDLPDISETLRNVGAERAWFTLFVLLNSWPWARKKSWLTVSRVEKGTDEALAQGSAMLGFLANGPNLGDY